MITVSEIKVPIAKPIIGDEEIENVVEVLKSGMIAQGPKVAEFEQKFAEWVGSDYGVAVNSGTAALHVALLSCGIGKGDEVITTPFTFIASGNSILYTGAKPVFADIDFKTYTINPESIEKLITENTQAIMPVQLYGQSANMDRINEIAEKHGLIVIEDAAQAHGAICNGKKVGSLGDMSCFSFYPTKPLGALGDSGAIVTDDEKIAKKLFAMRNYGSSKKYVNNIVGVNSRLDELQAAALQVSLKHVDDGVDYRNRIARRYLTEIKNTSVILPKCNPNSRHVYHVFALLSNKRNELQKHLFDCGISSLIHYPIPPHLQKCYTYLGYHQGDLPICEKYASCELSLPIYNGMPHEEVSLVINAVNSFKG